MLLLHQDMLCYKVENKVRYELVLKGIQYNTLSPITLIHEEGAGWLDLTSPLFSKIK